MSAMSDMSRAIRMELEKHGSTLADIPRDVLGEYVTLVWAFALDLKDEVERRDQP